MRIHFYKYQATGNDFVLVDNRTAHLHLTTPQIARICDRRFGIGADGIVLLEKDAHLDFAIVYYNGDGTQSLCGNGCRSAIDLAGRLGLVSGTTRFSAYDGEHEGEVLPDGQIRLRMNDVPDVREVNDGFFVDTGSPHFVKFVNKVGDYAVVEEGRKLRYSDAFKPAGANINFVETVDQGTLRVRTYERGVEDETLSCGTGVTAVSLAAVKKGYQSPVTINVAGGKLSVEFKTSPGPVVPAAPGNGTASHRPPASFHDIFLIGPAKMVFEGDLEL